MTLHGNKTMYRKCHIYYDPKPIPAYCGVDWSWYHDDFDGAPDANDNRCGNAESYEACVAAIDEMYEDEAERNEETRAMLRIDAEY